MPKFNFELLRTFILNFCCIHFKRRKKYICTRYLKRQLIFANKVNLLLIRYFIQEDIVGRLRTLLSTQPRTLKNNFV